MARSLLSCRVATPWRGDDATESAAWLTGPGHLLDGTLVDLIRADLDAVLPRAEPLSQVDRLVARAVSLPSAAPPQTWSQVESYAASAATVIAAWSASSGGWERGYSGPSGLADHLVLALARSRGQVGSWTAHIRDLPTHTVDGLRRGELVTPGTLRDEVARILGPGAVAESSRVADVVLALIAELADEIVVATDALAQALLAHPSWAGHPRSVADRLVVWSRPGVAAPATRSERTAEPLAPATAAGPAIAPSSAPERVRIGVDIDAHQLAMLQPVLTAYGALGPEDQARLRLVIRCDDEAVAAALLRRLGLEARVELTSQPPAEADYALVVDHVIPEGHSWSPLDLPAVRDHEASGLPVILLAPQDSPWTGYPAAHHLPADHVSAAVSLLRRLASTPASGPGRR